MPRSGSWYLLVGPRVSLISNAAILRAAHPSLGGVSGRRPLTPCKKILYVFSELSFGPIRSPRPHPSHGTSSPRPDRLPIAKSRPVAAAPSQKGNLGLKGGPGRNGPCAPRRQRHPAIFGSISQQPSRTVATQPEAPPFTPSLPAFSRPNPETTFQKRFGRDALEIELRSQTYQTNLMTAAFRPPVDFLPSRTAPNCKIRSHHHRLDMTMSCLTCASHPK